jgi:hypothetical protein
VTCFTSIFCCTCRGRLSPGHDLVFWVQFSLATSGAEHLLVRIFFAFNISEQAAPECTIAFTFFAKWLTLQLFPAVIIAIIALSYGAMLAAVVQALVTAHRAAAADSGAALPAEAEAVAQRSARLRSKVGRQYDLAVGSCFTVLCALSLHRTAPAWQYDANSARARRDGRLPVFCCRSRRVAAI